jgi:hypothetical protein
METHYSGDAFGLPSSLPIGWGETTAAKREVTNRSGYHMLKEI